MEKEEGCVIIASYGTFSTGINIKNLHNIVFQVLVSQRFVYYNL